MANQAAFVSAGETVPFVNSTGSAIDLNDIVLVGALIGLLSDCGMGTSGPNTSLANGSTGRARVKGVVEGPKVSGSGGAVIAGQDAYWDDTNNRFTPVAAGNRFAGVFYEAATQAASRCKVDLNVNAENQGANAQSPILVGPIDASASGDNAFYTPPFPVRLVNWGLRSKDTGAANVKLRYGSTDITGTTAKGTSNDALVAGGSIVEAQKNIAAATPILINLSAAQAVEVWAIFVRQ